MNRNGILGAADVQNDIQAFALALKNPLAYFNSYHIFGSDSGDLDGYRTNPSNFAPNGRLDFDDIDDFAALMAAGSGGSAADMLARIQCAAAGRARAVDDCI